MRFVGGAGLVNIDFLYSGMDKLPGKGEEVYADHFSMCLGGGVPATMINTSRLHVPSRMITFIGRDLFSEFARKEIEQYGVDVTNLYTGDGMPVILSTAMIYGQDRSFLSHWDKFEITQVMQEQIYERLAGACVVDMGSDFPDVYRRLKADGAIMVFDTGWEDDLSLEKYEESLRLADFYTPNRKEAMKITGTDTVQEAAEKLSDYFEHVIIKLDSEGCYLKNRDGEQWIPPLGNVTAVDSTGAGDAFMSGFIYGLYHHCPVEQCIRYGNVTGGTCVQAVGCLTKYVEEEELLRLGSDPQIFGHSKAEH